MTRSFVLVTDLDGTLVDAPPFPLLHNFNRAWAARPPDSLLVYNTGRSLQSYLHLLSTAPLLTPDILVCSVGTEIYRFNNKFCSWQKDLAYCHTLDASGWDRDALVTAASGVFGLAMQQASEQRPHKISLSATERRPAATMSPETWQAALSALRAALAATGVPHHVVASAGHDVDILPPGVHKGSAVLSVLSGYCVATGMTPAEAAACTLCCGDSGNDAAMLETSGTHACVVGNAHPELLAWAQTQGDRVYVAQGRCSAGILEAMAHFKLG